MFQQKNSNKSLLKYQKIQSVPPNPYFINRQRNRRSFYFFDWNWSVFANFLFYSLLCTSLLIIIYWLLFSSFFTIKNVHVLNISDDYEVKNLIQDFLQEKHWGFKKNNLFLMNKNKLKNRLLLADPRLSDVLIRKIEHDTISIELQYKKIAAYWQCEKKLYAFEADGTLINDIKADNAFSETMEIRNKKIFGSINISALGDYPIIKTWQIQCPANNKVPIQIDTLNQILKIFNYLKFYDLLKPVNFSFRDDIGRNLEVKTLHGFDIYFDLNLDILTQLKKFHTFYKFYLKNDLKNSLKYIDLRIKEKIFYQ